MSYNLRVGSAPGAHDIVPADADAATGWRRVPVPGNMSQRTTWTITLPDADPIYWSVQAIDSTFAGSAFADEQSSPATAVPEAAAALSPTLRILGANPIGGSANIEFGRPQPGWVRLALYDLAGRLVRRLTDRHFATGVHLTSWDGRDELGHRVPAAVYLVRMRVEQRVMAQKIAGMS